LTLKDEDIDENAEYIIDRYKKLEDSNFKRKFLDNITGSMEENLVASIQSNLVCFKIFNTLAFNLLSGSQNLFDYY